MMREIDEIMIFLFALVTGSSTGFAAALASKNELLAIIIGFITGFGIYFLFLFFIAIEPLLTEPS